MYHVVASDLDGTLLSPDHVLTPYTKKILNLLTDKGIHFIFATGRHHIDVGQIRDGLGIDAYMITSNGARVHNSQGDLVFSHNLAPEIARDLCLLEFDNPDVLTNYYNNDEWWVNRASEEQTEFFKESDFHYQIFQRDNFPVNGVCKVYYTSDDHDYLVQLEERIEARWGDKVNVSFSLRNCLEVMSGGVSKGEALAQVCQSIGYELSDCIAFGDGMNDREMLSVAGKGCIMQGAHQRLKDTLPDMEIIGANADDAVPRYLQKMYQV